MQITVLVTGVGGGGVGRQVMKSLRQGRSSYHIIGTDVTQISMGLYEADKHYVIPKANDGNYIGTLLEICERDNVKVLVPGSEPELQAISSNRDVFGKAGVLPLVNSTSCIDICMNKWKTYTWLLENGFNMPYSFIADRFTTHLSNSAFPVIVKPTVASGGSLNVYLAQDDAELAFFTQYLKRQGLIPMVQQYVGDYNQEYTVGVLTDMGDGALIGSIAVRRHILSGLSNRMRVKGRVKGKPDLFVISSGISQGEVDDYPEVRRECEQIALKIGSRGPMNFQCRKDGDTVYIFEINPRFSGTTFVRALVGYNEPDILIRRHLLGERDQKVEYKKGIVVRGLEERYIEPENC